MLILNLPF